MQERSGAWNYGYNGPNANPQLFYKRTRSTLKSAACRTTLYWGNYFCRGCLATEGPHLHPAWEKWSASIHERIAVYGREVERCILNIK